MKPRCQHRARVQLLLSSSQARWLKSSLTRWGSVHRGGFPARATRPGLPTCPDTYLAEQLGQAPHAVEGVEVVHVLVQPVHPVLVLQVEGDIPAGHCLPAWPQNKSSHAGACMGRGSQGAGKRVGEGHGRIAKSCDCAVRTVVPSHPRGLAAPTPMHGGAPTWGRPVRMLARLGEQLLTEVKAFWKTTLRRASASRLGVRMAELL